MDIKIAVICRLSNLINQKDITVNEVAGRLVCLVVPPLARKNIVYKLSKNAALFYEKKSKNKGKAVMGKFCGDFLCIEFSSKI